MYQDIYVTKEWEFTDPIAVRSVYKLFTDHGYAANHRLIDPDKYIFIYTMEGVGSFIVDHCPLVVGPNSLAVINAKLNLHYHCAGQKWNFWLVEFKTPNMLFVPNKVYPLTLGKPTLSLFAQVLQAIKQEHLQSAGALFQVLYYSSYHMVQAEENKQPNLLLNSAVLYMRENIRNFSVGELCHYLNIEERTLRNIFMRCLNTSPKKHFAYLRLEEAKRYLESTSTPITAIAAQLGFSNPGHFSTAFRKEYGCTPKQYRLAFNASETPSG